VVGFEEDRSDDATQRPELPIRQETIGAGVQLVLIVEGNFDPITVTTTTS